MNLVRGLLYAFPFLVLAACGPLEDADEPEEPDEALPSVLPDVAEPSPPGADDEEAPTGHALQRAPRPDLPEPSSPWSQP